MQLAYDDTLGTVDYKRAVVSHIWDVAQEDFLNLHVKIDMFGIRAVKFQFCLEGHTVGQTALQTLFDGVARRVDIIIQKLKNEIVSGVHDGEILTEHFVQTVVLALFWWGIQLEEVMKRLQLHLQEIGIGHRVLDRCKIDTVVDNFSHELFRFSLCVCVYVLFFRRKKVKNPLPGDSLPYILIYR